MQKFIGKKCLVTTTNWFFAPDGNQYRAIWGTLNEIHEAGKSLGFIPNRSHANWFIEIGKVVVMGCQVMYIIQCDEKPVTDKEKAYCYSENKGLDIYERPSSIYVTE